jgi:KDO2-lipid IV(A) lauroyltransferase
LALLDGLMRALPLRAARALGSFLGGVFFACVPYERKKTIATLARAYPDAEPAWRAATARAVFRHLGLTAAEFFRMSGPRPMDLDAWVAEVEGFEHLERAVREGRGVVAVTAHFGHWELLAAWVARRLPVSVVARQVYDARLDDVLVERRRRNAIGVFGRNTSVRPILRWLKDAKVLGVLADQDTGVDSLYVDFFGSPAKTPAGPAVLAQSTGADLVTGFCFRRPDGRYRLVFSAAIPVPPRTEEGPIALWGAVQEYTRRTEMAIRQEPGQWAWNHARWRSASSKPSVGWDPRLEGECLRRIEAWRAAGRPAL